MGIYFFFEWWHDYPTEIRRQKTHWCDQLAPPVPLVAPLVTLVTPTGGTAQKNRENIGVVDIIFFLEVTNHNLSYSWVKQLYPIAVELTSRKRESTHWSHWSHHWSHHWPHWSHPLAELHEKSRKYWSCGYKKKLEVTNHNISYSRVKQLYPIAQRI